MARGVASRSREAVARLTSRWSSGQVTVAVWWLGVGEWGTSTAMGGREERGVGSGEHGERGRGVRSIMPWMRRSLQEIKQKRS